MGEPEKIIALLGDQINASQADTIREIAALTKHGYAWIDLHIRVDGRETHWECDWLAALLNPRGPPNTTLNWKQP